MKAGDLPAPLSYSVVAGDEEAEAVMQKALEEERERERERGKRGKRGRKNEQGGCSAAEVRD